MTQLAAAAVWGYQVVMVRGTDLLVRQGRLQGRELVLVTPLVCRLVLQGPWQCTTWVPRGSAGHRLHLLTEALLKSGLIIRIVNIRMS